MLSYLLLNTRLQVRIEGYCDSASIKGTEKVEGEEKKR